jgi:hypothetical protein
LPADIRPAEFRYGAVFVLTLVLLVFVIVSSDTDGSLAVALALESAALVVVVATSRSRAEVRRARTIVGGLATVGVVLAVAFGAVPRDVVLAALGLLTLALPFALVGGLLRLVRTHGVTLQAVAGALTIYLLVGLLFAWAVALAAHLDSAPYFANGTDGSQGSRVYFSFTVLTTTGFGDLTAATPAGHALAVVEMLVGQLYLVTVIGVLVGGLARRS